MRICLLTEGSYPYARGDVSAWVQGFMEGLPEHEFIIYFIGAEAKKRGQFQYELPGNCVGVQEEFLEDILGLKSKGMKEKILTSSEKESLYDLVEGDRNIPFSELLEIFYYGREKHTPMDLFMSSDFFDIIQRVYEEKYPYLPFSDFYWMQRSMLLPLFYLLQQELPEADIYHSVSTGYCGIIGGMASAAYRKPFMITEHSIYPREREAEIMKSDWAKGDFKSVWIQYFYNLARLAYHSADHVYALFGHHAEIERELGCEPKKISVVPNGIHLENYAGIPEIQEHDGPISVGAPVQVVPSKDIVTLLRAFFLMKQEIGDARLYIIEQYEADPAYYELCQKTIRMLGVSDVFFTGTMDRAAYLDYLARMDFFVLSSIQEGQPLAMLEGLAARRPFVATDVGCCRELLCGDAQDMLGEAGFMAAPMDFEKIAEEMIRLAKDFHLRRRMGGIGYERVKNLYAFERFIENYRVIYEQEGKVQR